MIEPRSVLEIGSWHYETSDAIGKAMDDIYGLKGYGKIDSFDIRIGGYDGQANRKPKSKRVKPHFWYPHHSNYDGWKYAEKLPFDEFKKLTNDEITKENISILKKVASENNYIYDLIFIDGDHSYEGVKRDLEVVSKFSNSETLFVLDNVWDERLHEVRKFYNELPFPKWDFKEWNDAHYRVNQVQDTAIFIRP